MTVSKTLGRAATMAVAICLAVGGWMARADEPARSGTAWPKGHYGELDALPDWGGIWTLERDSLVRRERPVLKGEYLEAYEAWRREAEANHGMVRRTASNCRPPGMPYIMSVAQYPIEFLFTPGRITVHHEAWMMWRIIFTDGRGHPADLDPSFTGHSIGRWEGDTLVVDTVGIKDTLDLAPGMQHSDQLHILERIHLAKDDPDTLIVETAVEDPLALARPWQYQLTFKRSRDAELIEFVCTENDRNPVDADGHTRFD